MFPYVSRGRRQSCGLGFRGASAARWAHVVQRAVGLKDSAKLRSCADNNQLSFLLPRPLRGS